MPSAHLAVAGLPTANRVAALTGGLPLAGMELEKAWRRAARSTCRRESWTQ
jgi:hypothetical protein